MTIKDVAEKLFISPRCITNTMRRINNCTFHEWIEKRRIYEAQFRVRDNYFGLHQAASICGFDTYSTFYRAFKKEYGVSPKQYRENYQNQINNQ